MITVQVEIWIIILCERQAKVNAGRNSPYAG